MKRISRIILVYGWRTGHANHDSVTTAPHPRSLRSQLETAVKVARDTAEQAANATLTQLAIGEGRAPDYLSEAQKGLRYDVARMLKDRLSALGEVRLESKWTCLPSVTASGKAWCLPVARLIAGGIGDQDFSPHIAADGKVLSSQTFHKLLASDGIQYLDKQETGEPSGCAWVECGDLDHYGHEHGIGIGDEPLECGQVWTFSPGGQDEPLGLFRLEVTEGHGSGVHILDNPVPPAFRESLRCAEQNLYARAQQLVGDREPRAHEFSVQLRAFDAAKSGAKTSVAILIALASALLKKSVRGGLVMVGEVTLGGSVEMIHSAVTVAEMAIEKGAKAILLPVSCRRQMLDLSDEMATQLDIQFYQDGRDALLKSFAD